MRRRRAVIVSLAVLLCAGGLVAGYQRVSALTCSTPAYAAWVGEGDRGAGACLLYLALAPDTPPVRAHRAPVASSAASPAAAGRSPSPGQSQPSASAPEPAPMADRSPVAETPSSSSTAAPGDDSTFEYPSPDGVGTSTGTCQGPAFDFWREVAQSYGDGSSCQAYVDAVAETYAENPDMVQPGPSFRTSGETQYYYSLLDEETDWD